jgi:hypothetical protein
MRTFLLLLLSVGRLVAAPFLVCDPYPVQTQSTLNIAAFNVTGLTPQPFNVNATIAGDGTQSLHYDLSQVTLTNGQTYTVQVFAVNNLGIAGPSSSLTFQLGVPAAPSNLRISPN